MKLPPPKDSKQPTLNPIMQAFTHRQTANIHIDRIHIYAPCSHKPTGKVIYFDEDDLGMIPSAATANQKTLKDGGEKAYMRSKDISGRTGIASMIEIHCCPPKILQKHNLFGHANLQDYVYAILDIATKRVGILVEPDDREQWKMGCVTLTEIHLTGNFGRPAGMSLPIIDAIDDNNSYGKLRKIATCITLDKGGKRRSTFHALTIYDKMLEMMSHSDWKKPGPYQCMLLAEADKGIRAEVKLYSQVLKHRKLGYVSRWRGVDVAALYFEYLDKYKLQYAIQRLLTEDELACLTRSERNAYTLWLNRVAIKDQYSRTTAWKITKAIEGKTGINIGGNRRPEALPAIDLSAIFTPENVLPVPSWAFGTDYYVPPSIRTRSISNVPVDPEQVDDDVDCSPPPKRSISNVPVYLDEDELAALSPPPRKIGRSISNVPVDPGAVD
jgi:hypothetical protein